jgi:uncharacterized protein YabE (DUF348 family)
LLRSVKYGLNAAVLAGLVAAPLAWTHVDKTVTLVVDGHRTQVHTTAGTVDGVLVAAGYHAGRHDILAPDETASVHDGSTIVLERGRLLRLDIDGAQRQVWTTAPTVAAAMSALGYSARDFTSVSRSRRLPLGPTDITVRTPKVVTVVHDGKTQHVTTTDATVGQLLAALRVPLGPHDAVSVDRDAALTQDERIVVKRVEHSQVTVDSAIPFSTRTSDDAALSAGQTRIVHPGRDGLARITYALVFVDGKEAGRTKIKAVVVRVPRPKVVKVGTKHRPPVVRSAARTDAGPVSGSLSPKAFALRLASAQGWDSTQYGCLVTLWNHESNWNVHASNGSSGAYGIPQALPGSKMASAGPDWQDDADTQITWGIGYIAGRYGTPCNAWSYWQSSGWY